MRSGSREAKATMGCSHDCRKVHKNSLQSKLQPSLKNKPKRDMAIGTEKKKEKRLGKHDDMPLYPDRSRPERPRYINIGAGRFYHPYWHNLDNPSPWYAPVQHNVDIPHNLIGGTPFPIETSSLSLAYTSHVIEHIKNSDVAMMFRETYRCLEPGGIFRVVCPDMELEHSAYARGDRAFFYWRRFPAKVLRETQSVEQIFLRHFAAATSLTHPDTRCPKFDDEAVQQAFIQYQMEDFFDHFCSLISDAIRRDYPQHHSNWFTHDKVISMLRESGFETVYESRYGQSQSPLMRNVLLFDNSRPTSALHVEAIKQR